MAVKVNRVNRNFGLKVHLYYNPSSWNRPSDSTPRFYLKPVELLSVEKVAFTKKSKDKGYYKQGHRYWRGRPEDILTQDQIYSMYEEIKNSFPYGYVEGDIASTNKYVFDVKENEAFQSFYKDYWYKNIDKVKSPVQTIHGRDYPFSYIEFEVDEVITYKHNVGTVPALPEGVTQWGDYLSMYESYYSEPIDWSCNDDTLDISININKFLVEGFGSYILKLGSTGNRYRFDLKSITGTSMVSSYGYNAKWPTGVGGSYSGYKFRLSTGIDGTHNGFDEYTDNVSWVTSPEVAYYHVAVYEKTWGSPPNHPFYSSGSTNGFNLSGSGGTADLLDFLDEGPTIDLRRDSTYYFVQTQETNENHPIYISTDPSGMKENVYSSGVYRSAVGDNYIPGTGDPLKTFTRFTVPVNAPDTLYYACENHEYMGGRINVVNPPEAPYSGSIPGESVVVTFTGNKNEQMYFYSPDRAEMGGTILLKKDCGSSAALFDPLETGDYGYA